MLWLITVIIFSVGGAYGTCPNPNPDGTEHRLYYTNCPNGPTGPYPLQLIHAEIDDANGKAEYPINISAPVIMNARQVLDGRKTYRKLNVDVDLYAWTNVIVGNCSWHYIPTFGLLHDLDGCAIAGNCPLKPGHCNFKQTLDLGKFGAIIVKLGKDLTYQLKIQVKEMDDSSGTYIGCALIEGRID